MLDIKYIRDNKDEVLANAQRRGVKIDLDRTLHLDDQRKLLISQIDNLRSERNKVSKSKPSEEEIQRMRGLGDEISKLEASLTETEKELRVLMMAIPNLTHHEVPTGGENDYKVIYKSEAPKPFKFDAKNHEELMLALDLIDFDRASKVVESKFYFLKNDMVKLNLALLQYGVDILSKHGFILLETPDLAKDSIIEGIGFNPRGPESQIYSIENSDLSLIGTAEITLGGYHSGEILDLSKPKLYAGISHCFRTEAGSYGRESKGLYRVHQFTKLEMFVYCKPEESDEMHEKVLAIEKEIIEGLEIPYRVIDVASGDLGGPAFRKFDIEAWMTMKKTDESEGGYAEITSASNCTDYQARRLNVKYRKEDGSVEYAHTLNGTAVVLSRFPIALIENHQTKKGTISIPKALRKYMGGQKEISIKE